MYIFISYSRENAAFAKHLADDLSNYDLRLWMDVRNIPHGANWDAEVEKGLAGCDVMLVLLSRGAVASENVADEWSYFIEKGKTIVPLLLEDCEVPFRLSRRQRVDFRGEYQNAFQEMIRALGSPVLLDAESTIRVNPPPVTSEGKAGKAEKPSRAERGRTTTEANRAAPPEVSVKMFPILWAEHYHWFQGMRNGVEGDILINPREIALIPHANPIITIPYPVLITVKALRSFDAYLKLTYSGGNGEFKSLVLMSASKKNRRQANEQIMDLINLFARRGYSGS
jgi:hypothetical protein